MYRRHPREIKERAVFILNQGFLSMEEVADIIGCSTRSLRRWLSNMEEYGDVLPPRNLLQGRPRILSTDQMTDVLAAIDDDPSMLLQEIQEWIAIHFDLAISISSIHRNLVNCAYTY